jgi:hypothetical protein
LTFWKKSKDNSDSEQCGHLPLNLAVSIQPRNEMAIKAIEINLISMKARMSEFKIKTCVILVNVTAVYILPVKQ